MARSAAQPEVSFWEQFKAAQGAEIPNPHKQAEGSAPVGPPRFLSAAVLLPWVTQLRYIGRAPSPSAQ